MQGVHDPVDHITFVVIDRLGELPRHDGMEHVAVGVEAVLVRRVDEIVRLGADDLLDVIRNLPASQDQSQDKGVR